MPIIKCIKEEIKSFLLSSDGGISNYMTLKGLNDSIIYHYCNDHDINNDKSSRKFTYSDIAGVCIVKSDFLYIQCNSTSFVKQILETECNIKGILGPYDQVSRILGAINKEYCCDHRSSLMVKNASYVGRKAENTVVGAAEIKADTLFDWFLEYGKLACLEDPSLTKYAKAQSLICKDRFVILDSNGTPVSIGGFASRFGEFVEIGPIWTPVRYRGKGYAKQLLDYLLWVEDPNKKIILYTYNPAAVSLYKKCGFEKVTDLRYAVFKK